MGSDLVKVVPFILLLLLRFTAAYPLCLNQESPFKSSQPLTFCTKYSDYGCCTPERDAALAKEFSAGNNRSAACAAIAKDIICAECDPWAADLYGATNDTKPPRALPFLCGSNNASANSSYCGQVWDTCPALRSGTVSNQKFCSDNAPTSDSGFCFSGGPFAPPPGKRRSNYPTGLCFERISEEAYVNFVPHTDGKRVFLTTQPGAIYLAEIPSLGGQLTVSDALLFLDLTSRVSYSPRTELGLLGLALHPQFSTNGRFFVSYTCDSQAHADCKALCGCYAVGNCSVETMQSTAKGGSAACRNTSIVAEYSALSAQGTLADVANTTEVRRIFSMGHPFGNHNGGDLHFGPANGFLYFTMGDGGSANDPLRTARNKALPLGKILRLDVDGKPGSLPSATFPLSWGNYSIPADNPFASDNDDATLPEIYALGLRNPWRCSFDRERPNYFLCGDVGQDKVEEVDLIIKGADYGWSLYEGTRPVHARPGTNYSGLTWPVMEYNRTMVSPNSASVTGGYIARSMTDPCIYGLYVFNDWLNYFFVGEERPLYSGSFNFSGVPFMCANVSGVRCRTAVAQQLTMTWAWAEDLAGDLYTLGIDGIHRIISPDRCGYPTCTAAADAPPGGPGTAAPAPGVSLSTPPTAASPDRSAAGGDRSPGFLGRKMLLTSIVCVGVVVNHFLGPQIAAVVACLLAIKFAPGLLIPTQQ